jgi:acyl-ACP thioesterase
MMGQENNTHYIDWIFDCFRFDQIRGNQLDWIQINYSSEVKPEEEVKISIGENADGSYTVEGYNLTSETIAFEAQFALKDKLAVS